MFLSFLFSVFVIFTWINQLRIRVVFEKFQVTCFDCSNESLTSALAFLKTRGICLFLQSCLYLKFSVNWEALTISIKIADFYINRRLPRS